jgi:hypothetical protein
LALFGDGDDRVRRTVEASDELRRRFGERAVTRARLIGTGLPAPFERDMGSAVEHRGVHAADAVRPGRRPGTASGEGRDSQGDTELDEIPPDDA